MGEKRLHVPFADTKDAPIKLRRLAASALDMFHYCFDEKLMERMMKIISLGGEDPKKQTLIVAMRKSHLITT